MHAAAIAASDSQSKVFDLTRDLENITISGDLDEQDPALESGEAIPDSIVLDSRINEESLSKFRPLAKISQHPSRPDIDSQLTDKPTLPKDESNISRKLPLSKQNSTKDDSFLSSSMEQSLITAFKDIRISSTAVKTGESNRIKLVLKPETSSYLVCGPRSTNSKTTLAVKPILASTTTGERSKWKAI